MNGDLCFVCLKINVNTNEKMHNFMKTVDGSVEK